MESSTDFNTKREIFTQQILKEIVVDLELGKDLRARRILRCIVRKAHITFRRPLIGIWMLKAILVRDQKKVKSMLESSSIVFSNCLCGININVKGASGIVSEKNIRNMLLDTS